MEWIGHLILWMVIFGAGVITGYIRCSQQNTEEVTPSASHNSHYTKCKELLRRAWMELEHRSLEPDLTDEIEQHFA